MGRFVSKSTGVTFSVDDSKDARYGDGWESADKPSRPEPKTPAKKAASSKSEK